MISLTRDRSAAAVPINFQGAKRRELALELLKHQREIALGTLPKHKFVSTRWKKAKDPLSVETNGKCAYCEASFQVVAYGDVEHFRPKSIYWWLAYCYENYLASCQICNGTFKRNKFPTKFNVPMVGPAVTSASLDAEIEAMIEAFIPDSLDDVVVQNYKNLHDKERPLLLNPYYDKPEDYFAWKANDVLREVELIPLPSNPEAPLFVKAAIDLYGLNRPKLKQQRYFAYRPYGTYLKLLDDPVISVLSKARILADIEYMKADMHPFAGMFRYFEAVRNAQAISSSNPI
jgi:hypothetical protein